MAVPRYSHSGRRPHYWRLRAEGYRELLSSKNWRFRGAYAAKSIHGREVMLIIVEKGADTFLCRLQLKDDLWSVITKGHLRAVANCGAKSSERK